MPILTDVERVGTTLGGKYRLKRILGQGGMALIYEAQHLWTGREVAVKVLLPDFATDPHVSSRFWTEAQATAGLQHPNIVEVLDMGKDPDGTVFLVLELLRGETWKERISRGKVPLPELLRLFGPLMEALSEVHERGIVHRDLKPENLFVHQPGTAPQGAAVEVLKLLDFGLARVTASAEHAHRTVTGTVLGTPSFMSPEQASAQRDVGPPSDVWALAIVIYLSLTAQRPYRSQGVAVIVEIVKEGPRPIEEADPTLPKEVSTWIGRALSRDPAARPTMRELLAGLVSACGERPARQQSSPVREVSLEELELFGPAPEGEVREEGLDTIYDPSPSGASTEVSASALEGLLPSSPSVDTPISDPELLLASLERNRSAGETSAPSTPSRELDEAATLMQDPRPRAPSGRPLPPLAPPAQRASAPPPEGGGGERRQGEEQRLVKGMLAALLLSGLAICCLAAALILVLSDG